MKLFNISLGKVREQRGFTLIELMIVVGIIGILVAIAAPNFARYQSKARQSEAKIALAAIYAGEKSFYSEYSAYVSSMDAIGYAPEGNKRFYTVGFASVNTTGVQGYPTASITTPSFARINFPATWTNCTPALTSGVATGADPQTFTVVGSGQIRQGLATCDDWTINDTKILTNAVISL
jgi:prepilin-type N-terminal cleavage/methylation domain-containing protein